jgi:glycosyltransferase involved in cell wall biosynthesis
MQDNPMVSVLMLTYNHEKFIAQAIESVLTQRANFKYELVIGEDCSADSTRDIIIDYKERHSEIIKIVLQDKNKGGHNNFRSAYALCKGEYIASLDGDDFWTDPFKLQKQVDFLENNNEYVICHHDAMIVNERNELITNSQLPDSSKRDLTADELIRCNLILTLTVCFRRVIHLLPEEFFRVYNADTFLFSMLGNYGKAKYLGDIIRADTYREHPGGVWSLLDEWQSNYHSMNTVYWLSKHYGRIGMKGYSLYFAKQYKNYWSALFKESIVAKDYWKLLKLCSSFISRPKYC